MSDGIDDNPSNPSVDGNRHNNITTTIIPRDYFITSAKPNGLSRPDKNNLHARSEWEKTYDLVKSEINNQLIESFVLAAQEKRFSKHPVTKLYHIGQAWKTDASKKDDYAHICYGHFKKGWEKIWRKKWWLIFTRHTTTTHHLPEKQVSHAYVWWKGRRLYRIGTVWPKNLMVPHARLHVPIISCVMQTRKSSLQRDVKGLTTSTIQSQSLYPHHLHHLKHLWW